MSSDKTPSSIPVWLSQILHSMRVKHIEASFSGGGDEGSLDEVKFGGAERTQPFSDGIEMDLEGLRVRGACAYDRSFLDFVIESLEKDVEPFGNYADGDGGSARIMILVDEEGAWVEEGDFTPGSSWDDDEYDDEFEEGDLYDAEEEEDCTLTP